jgi:hypothetical protein
LIVENADSHHHVTEIREIEPRQLEALDRQLLDWDRR